MIASAEFKISSKLFTASCFSIFAMTITCFFLFLITFLIFSTSVEFLTKDCAIKSTSSFRPRSKNSISFLVTESTLMVTPGRLIPLQESSGPPVMTSQTAIFLGKSISSTLHSIKPSSMKIRVPGLMSSINLS